MNDDWDAVDDPVGRLFGDLLVVCYWSGHKSVTVCCFVCVRGCGAVMACGVMSWHGKRKRGEREALRGKEQRRRTKRGRGEDEVMCGRGNKGGQ